MIGPTNKQTNKQTTKHDLTVNKTMANKQKLKQTDNINKITVYPQPANKTQLCKQNHYKTNSKVNKKYTTNLAKQTDNNKQYNFTCPPPPLSSRGKQCVV